jgi:hypothetical protein
MNNKKTELIKLILICLVSVFVIYPILIMLGWSWFVVPVFQLKLISYSETLGLIILLLTIFYTGARK